MNEEVKNLIQEASECGVPGRLAEILTILSGWYANIAQQLEDIIVFKADRILDIRQQDGVKSDRMAELLWNATLEGKDEIRFRSQLKTIEKMQNAIKFRLKVKENESWGKY